MIIEGKKTNNQDMMTDNNKVMMIIKMIDKNQDNLKDKEVGNKKPKIT